MCKKVLIISSLVITFLLIVLICHTGGSLAFAQDYRVKEVCVYIDALLKLNKNTAKNNTDRSSQDNGKSFREEYLRYYIRDCVQEGPEYFNEETIGSLRHIVSVCVNIINHFGGAAVVPLLLKTSDTIEKNDAASDKKTEEEKRTLTVDTTIIALSVIMLLIVGFVVILLYSKLKQSVFILSQLYGKVKNISSPGDTTPLSAIEFTDKMLRFSNEFAQTVSKLTRYQDDNKALYNRVLENLADFHNHLYSSLEPQHKQMQEILDAMKSYEKTYIDKHQRIDKDIHEFVTQVSKTNNELSTGYKNISAATTKQIDENLSKINDTLKKHLSDVSKTLDRFDSPLQNSARRIEGSVEIFYKNMGNIIGDFKNEYLEISKGYKQQIENNTTAIKNLDALTQTMEKLRAVIESRILKP